MANKVLVKRGLQENLNNAGVTAGELKFTTDTHKLYIGTGTENIPVGGDGTAEWGGITGDIEDQADLLAELNKKVDTTRKVNGKALSADITLKTSDIENDSNYATTTQVDAAGHKLSLSMDTTDFILTINLIDKNNNVIDTKTVDMPLEELVVSGSYDATNKKIVLTLKSGDTIDIPVSDMLSGLVNSSRKIGSKTLAQDISEQDLFNDLKDYRGTVTLKTISADENNITNLTKDNLKSGKFVTEFGETPSDENFVSEKLVYDSLALKQDKTDLNLSTTAKTVVGAINELKTALDSGTIDGGTF